MSWWLPIARSGGIATQQAWRHGAGARSVPLVEATLVRTLRTSRIARRRAVEQKNLELLVKATAAKRVERTKPIPAVPSYIRVRDLAKMLKRPVEEVLKKVVTRKNRRLHMTLGMDRFEFKNVKQVILPFQLAEQVAAKFDTEISYDDVEPTFMTWPQRTVKQHKPEHVMQRNPVIAVMGHVDHGKTTLMDTLRGSNITKTEAHGITQKINICEAVLAPGLQATFLDTPGHFHFFRMRNNAAQVADLVLLIVAGDEGCLLQTEESIGAIEESRLPTIACINKVDITPKDQVDQVHKDLRSFVALQTCPVVDISAKTGENLDQLKQLIAEAMNSSAAQTKRSAYIGPDVPAQGIVLESIVMKGRGTVLRVLLKSGILKKQDHFVAGMIHGVVRSVRNADSGKELAHAVPGTIVDVTFANKSKTVDAPIEFGFFVLPEPRAKQVIEQRQLALDFAENVLPREETTSDSETEGTPRVQDAEITPLEDEGEDSDEFDENSGEWVAEDAPKSIIVKAEAAGSLASIQDTVDEMQGLNTVRIGIGHITARDIDVAINKDCPIFGFKVKLRHREQKLAKARGVRVVLRSTIHGLIEEIERFNGKEQS